MNLIRKIIMLLRVKPRVIHVTAIKFELKKPIIQ